MVAAFPDCCSTVTNAAMRVHTAPAQQQNNRQQHHSDGNELNPVQHSCMAKGEDRFGFVVHEESSALPGLELCTVLPS